MSIVYGYDFSEASIEALPGAAAIASVFKTPLVLVHVSDPAMRALSAELERSLQGAIQKRLDGLAAELKKAQPWLEVRAVQLTGSALEELQTFAARERAEVLVVASGGHSELRRGIGSLSERLARWAEVPVLVIRDPGPWLDWAIRKRPLRAVLGMSRDSTCKAALEVTTRFRTAAPCDVVVTEVYFGPELANHYGLQGAPSWFHEDAELEELVARDLEKRSASLGGTGAVRFRPSLSAGRPAEPLLDVAERERAELVVVGRHPALDGFRLGSVSQGVLHEGRMAVLVVPAGSRTSRRAELPKYEHLLVATDLSPFGNQAVPQALALARSSGAVLSLLHVTDPEASDHEGRSALAAKLRQLVPERWPLPIRTEVISSRDPGAAIAAAAERIDADAICIASHARRGLARAALGSVTEELIRKTHRPVLVVRPAED